MNVMNLMAVLSLDDSQYNSKLNSAKGSASKFAGGVSSSFKKAGTGVSTIGTKISAVGAKITGFGTKMQSAGTSITNLGKKFAPISLAAGAVFVPAVKGAMSFEDKVAKVSTLVDTSKVSVDKLKNTFMQLSNETGISAEELAEAGYQALSASVPIEKLGEFTKTSANLAKAGFTSTATSVDVLTTAMNAYGEKAGSAEQIANKLVKTQNLGKTTVDELAKNMGKVIPVASASNVNINQLTSAYVTLTKQGINTRIATTQIKTLIDELGKSGSKSGELIKNKTGKSFKELMDSGVPLSQVLKDLETAAEADGKSLKDMFSSSQAGAAALALMVNDGKDFNDALTQMEKDTNDVDIALKKLGSTSGAKIRKSLTLLKNAGIALGSAFLKVAAPAITKIANFIQNLSVKFQKLDPNVQKTIAVILGIATALAPVLIIVGKVVTVMGTITKGIGGLVTGISFLFSPMGLIVVAIAAVIAIGVLLYKNWDKIKATALAVKETITKAFATMWTAVKTRITAMLNGIKVTFNNIRTAIVTAVNTIRSRVTSIWNAIKTATSTIWNGVKTTVGNLVNGIKETVSNVFNAVKTTVGNIWDGIKSKIESAIKGAKETVNTIAGKIKEILGFKNLATNVSALFKKIGEFLSNPIKTARDAISKAKDKIVSFLGFKNLSGNVKALFEKIGGFLSSPINTAKTAISKAIEKIKGFLNISGHAKTVEKAFNTIKKAITGPIDTAKGLVEGAFKTIKGLFPIKLGKIFKGIQLPYFKISGGKIPWGIGGQGEKPKVTIDWKKTAMNRATILDGATIFGASGGKLLGGGEAGRELIIGENYALDLIRKASGNGNLESLMLRLLNMLEIYLPQKTVAYVSRNDIRQTVDRELGRLL